MNKSFDYILENQEFKDNDIFFEVSLQGKRGLYVRDFKEADSLIQATVQISPQFKEKESNQAKIDFEVHLSLIGTES